MRRDTSSLRRNLARKATPPLILLLAAVLRFYRLSGQSLWSDEGNSVALARRGFIEITRRTAFDIHPPFYYWLLKIWILVFGDSEIGLRSLSVVLGIAVVYLIGVLGTRLFGSRVGLMAAFVAALSPFQVYYAQEARMYMLLTLLGSLTVLLALLTLEHYQAGQKNETLVWVAYVLTVAAGLYTHYAYPLILILVNVVVLLRLIQNSEFTIHNSQLTRWFSLQIISLLLYLPWLPIAWRQVTTWPSEQSGASLLSILETISITLLFGLSWPYNFGLVAVGGLGIVLFITFWIALKPDWQNTLHASRFTLHAPRSSTQRPSASVAFFQPPRQALLLLWLWFLFPVALTAMIFSPAFLKFLLVATPPLALLIAVVIERLTFVGRHSRNALQNTPIGYLAGGVLLAILAGAAVVSLYHYYTDSTFARDNYRGIVNFIKAVGDPEDAIILNAEGQQDVFNYYFAQSPPSPIPVYPLPRRRPLDEAATLNELQQIAGTADKIYATYWATHQADPDGVIEGWLDSHLFKATDRWYGNVRLVSYANPQTSAEFTPVPVDHQFGQHIRLTGYALSSSQTMPGDILQVALTWETDSPLVENYTVFVQVLDQANHLVGQRDAPPQRSTPDWPTGKPVTDGHGVFIEPGTPPGQHKVIVGLYNSESGQRLPITTGRVSEEVKDFIELGVVKIVRPHLPLPYEAFDIQVPLNQRMLEVTLLGYDLYKLGYRSKPDTPLRSGDALHVVAYWSANQPVQGLDDRLFIQVVTLSGRNSLLVLTRQPAGTDYSIREWQPGEIIRAQYDLFLNNIEPGSYRLALTLGVRQSSMQQVVALTKPFRVE